MNEYAFEKAIITDQLIDEMNTAGLPVANLIETVGTSVKISYVDRLSEDQMNTLNAVMDAHAANSSYVKISDQSEINKLIGYLNSPNTTVSNTARAVMILNLAPRLQPDLIAKINLAIAAKLNP